jgi:hypothetical protein
MKSRPQGSAATIYNPTAAIASFTPDVAGSYQIVLTVADSGLEASATVVITATAAAAPALTATPGDGSVTLSWPSFSGATSYFVYYLAGSQVTTITGTRFSALQSPFNFTGLSNGTQYAFVLTAITAGGETQASTVVTATPAVAAAVPAAPVATAMSGDGSVVVTWPAVAGATSYNIYYLQGSQVGIATGDRRASVVSPYTVNNLSNGLQYVFIVTAINAIGESAPSATASATPTAATALPAAPAATVLAGDGMVTLSWGAVNTASSYYIYWKAGSTAAKTDSRISSPQSPKIISGLTNATQYAFVVTAINSIGEGPASQVVTATPVAPTTVTIPSSPSLQVVAGDGNVSIAWQPVSGAVTYNLYCKQGSQVSKIDGIPVVPIPSSSPYILTGLVNSYQYAFIVTAVNAAGESLASNMITATPTASTIAPQTPANPGSQAGDGQVTLYWDFVPEAASYNLYWLAGSTVTLGTGTKVSGATSYTVYYKAGTSVSTTAYDQRIPNIGTQGYMVSNLSDSMEYAFIVTANNAAGESAASAVVTANAARVLAAKQALAIGYASGDSYSSVTHNLTLATSGLYGTSIGWASDTAATITTTGTVTRSASSVAVTLTATIIAGGISTTKAFQVTVAAAAASSNADLSALTVSSGTLTPTFAAATISYTVSVENSVTSITVAGTKADANASLAPAQSSTLVVVANTITLTVTAQSGGTPQVYRVTVTRDAAVPTVQSLTPANGVTGVDIFNPNITASFNTDMDSSTINAASYTLMAGTTSVTGTVSYNPSMRIATFLPSASLAYLTTYTGMLTTAVKSLAGLPLASNTTWTFTTAGATSFTSPGGSGIRKGVLLVNQDRPLSCPMSTSRRATISTPRRARIRASTGAQSIPWMRAVGSSTWSPRWTRR